MPNLNFHLINLNFRFEKLAVASSDGMAALNKRFLRFFPVS